MESFLEQTAALIYARHQDNLDRVCLVSPNRRAALYLRKYLAKLIDRPVWLPEMLTIEDFAVKYSGYALADTLSLLFELHAVHVEIEGENAQPFEKFMQWGQMLMGDFNEVDLYLADPKQLYSYLSDDKALELWNLSGEPLTEFEKNYLSFFTSMQIYYTRLHDFLKQKNIAWQGMAYRKLAEETAWMDTLPYDKIYFIGFNALTKAEEKITTRLERMGKAEMLWDADSYYVDNPVHEAGRFLRQAMKPTKEGTLHWKGDYFKTLTKQIIVRGVPNKVSQAKEAGRLIARLLKENSDLTGTALVLADESLLLPVLNAIPEASGDFNVTMGFSLTYTPLYSLIDTLFKIHATSAQVSAGKAEPLFYTKELLRLLMHPYFARLGGGYQVINTLAIKLRNSKLPFQTPDQIIDTYKKSAYNIEPKVLTLLELILSTSWQTTADTLDNMTRLTGLLKLAFPSPKETTVQGDLPIEHEYFFAFARLIFRLKKMHEQYVALNNIETLRQIVLQLLKLEKIPFYGEPLKGIQIMGMLETRTLDFDRVILLGANDDLLPGSRKHDSFIPYNIKTEFGIPIHTDKDAVMAYHFYRLLQRSKEVWMFYNTEANSMGGGDKSRFILQLKEELTRTNPGTVIDMGILTLPPAGKPDKEGISIVKTEAVLSLLNKLADTGFSHTSLSKYVNCPLQFYFSVVLKLTEPEEIEETIDASVMGSVIHEVLLTLYQDHVNELITADHINAMIKKVPDVTQAALKKNVNFKGSYASGKNLLIAKVSQLYVVNYLKKERSVIIDEHTELYIRLLENEFSYLHPFADTKKEGELRHVKIKGLIDRIDQSGETLRLIDYKSGNVDERKELKVSNPEELFTDPGKSKALQLLIYKYLIEKNPETIQGSYAGIAPGIISLRKFGSYLMPLNDEEAWSSQESYKDFGDILSELFRQIYDADTAFTATTDTERCKYCSFKAICNR
jgi:CRISPR/Cas system-associated exonuclease Cas4 (RecB family)